MSFQQIQGFYHTEPLWHKSQFGIQQFEFPKVDLTHFEPQEIPKNLRLGHQMEYAFEQLIRFEGTYDILIKNQPIRAGKTTVGEIDFILKHKDSKEVLHVELTYKFYIIDSSISEPIHRLMGPNRRDMFFTKMEKIKHEQFELVHRPESKVILEQSAIDVNQIQHRVCFKGQLFSHFNEQTTNIRPLNTDCLVGHWMRFDEFEQAAYAQNDFYIPYKKEWPIQPHVSADWMGYREALMEINMRMIQKNAPMIWMRKASGELEKFFVVWW